MGSPRSLATFLRARIREEESAALDARRWFHSVADDQAVTTGPPVTTSPAAESFAAFVLAHEPDRVLRECVAKRKIIDLVTGRSWSGSEVERDSVLRHLALPYAGHPEFRGQWHEPT